MNLPKPPKLPAAVAGLLGVLAFVLALVEPTLSEPWHAVVAGAIAVLTILGVPTVHAAVTAHGNNASTAAAESLAQEIRRRPPSSMRAPAALLAVVALLAGGSLSADTARWLPFPHRPAPAAGHPVRQPAAVITVAALIGDSRMSCTGAVLHVVLRDLDAAGKTLRERAAVGTEALELEGWFDGAWRPTAATGDGAGHFATSAPYGRWRVLLATGWGAAASEPLLITAADQCASGTSDGVDA